jgi:hypothetical protein
MLDGLLLLHNGPLHPPKWDCREILWKLTREKGVKNYDEKISSALFNCLPHTEIANSIIIFKAFCLLFYETVWAVSPRIRSWKGLKFSCSKNFLFHYFINCVLSWTLVIGSTSVGHQYLSLGYNVQFSYHSPFMKKGILHVLSASAMI